VAGSPPPDDPLAAHFAGKRRWARFSADTSVGLQGNGATFEARLLDLSRGGFLAAIEDPAFYADAAEDGLALVHARFPEGVRVRFPETGIERRAQIVRLTPHGEGGIALGCRFDEALTGSEAVRLGVAAAESGHPEATAAVLSGEPRARPPISVLLFAGADHVAGPYAMGRILGIGERAVDVAFVGDRDAVLTDLAEGPVQAAFVRGTTRLWEGTLDIAACTVEDGRQSGSGPLRLRLMAESSWGRRVTKHVRRRG
jgi:hypothetical protein